MRVLIVNDFGMPVGGGERMSIALRDGLRARGHEARLLTTTAAPLPLANQADVTCFGTTGPASRVTRVFNVPAARKLRREIETYRPDVVHVRMFLQQLSPLILPVLRGVPSLLHVISYDLICPLDTKTLPDGSACRSKPGVACKRNGCMPWLGVARTVVQHGLVRRWLGAFDRVIANSRWVQQRLEAEGVRCDGYVWNGVAVRPARPPLAGPPTVGFAGRLVEKKGGAVLLRAFAKLAGRLPEAKLVIAGDGPARPELEHLAQMLSLNASVQFTGHLRPEAMEATLNEAWVQAVPGLWEEPFGLVVAEAMMRGTAVVASATGGPAEQVLDGETGLLVPPGDADRLAEALTSVLSDPAQAEGFGAAGRLRALACFTEERQLQRFETIYESLP